MERIYYKIGEVAEMLGEEVSTVRFWSDTFPRYLKPERNAKGNRLFRPEDVEVLRSIHYLSRVEGLTLDGIARRLAEGGDEVARRSRIYDKLRDIRAQLSELYDTI